MIIRLSVAQLRAIREWDRRAVYWDFSARCHHHQGNDDLARWAREQAADCRSAIREIGTERAGVV